MACPEFEKSCFEAQLHCINTSIEKSFDVTNPDRQPAQWLKEGVRLKKLNRELTRQLLAEVDKYGGTDHPDPTFW